MRSLRPALGLACFALLGCGAPDGAAGPPLDAAGAPTPDASVHRSRPTSAVPFPTDEEGLVETARIEQPEDPMNPGAAHLGDLLLDGETAYAANSFGRFAVYRAGAGEQLALLFPRPADVSQSFVQCSTLALHAPSHTLFCSNPNGRYPSPSGAYTGYVSSFTVGAAQPQVARLVAAHDPRLQVKSLLVRGDRLLLAGFRAGLWSADIQLDGTLANLAPTAVAGDIRKLASDGNSLIALDQDRGLVALAIDASGNVSETGALPLDGPMLDASVRGGRAAVALGSQGAALVDLSGAQPALIAHLDPGCVVTSADVAATTAALACTSGLYLYDLASSPPRLAGFQPAHYAMLQVRYAIDGLVATDWQDVVRYSFCGGGHARVVDVPRGRYEAPGRPFAFEVRNPGDDELSVQVFLDAMPDQVLDLPPATTVSLQFPPTVVRAAVAGTRPQALVELQACLADGSSCSSTRRRVVLVARPATDDPAHGHPGEGDPMPPIALVAPDGSVMTAPPANAAARVIFYSYDCAAMWPELEDQAWLASHAMLPRGAAPVLVSDGDPTEYDAGYYDRWRLSGLLRGYTDDASSWSSAVGAVDSAFGRVVYDDGFLLDEIPGSALHPTDYSVDASGTVVAVEKEYRAGFTLLP